jgi:hypothetical protein
MRKSRETKATPIAWKGRVRIIALFQRILFFTLVATATAGCVSATPLLTAEGKTRFFLDCGRQGVAKCIAKANEICPDGYVIDGDSKETSWSFNRYGGGSSTARTMTITCRS